MGSLCRFVSCYVNFLNLCYMVEAPSNGSRIWRPPVAEGDFSDDSDEELERQTLTKQMTGEVGFNL